MVMTFKAFSSRVLNYAITKKRRLETVVKDIVLG